jgi:hypothetical protein
MSARKACYHLIAAEFALGISLLFLKDVTSC